MDVDLAVLDRRSDRFPEAIAVLARAFWRDPFFEYFSLDPLHEYRTHPGFQRAALDAPRTVGTVVAAVDRGTGGILGVAGWVPPDPPGSHRWRAARETALMVPTFARIRHRRVARAVLAECERRHPAAPHRYLAILGVDPAAQGRGVGAALLRHGLGWSDAEGVSTYLETQKADNVAWYARFGFEERGTIDHADAPTLWLLERPAR